MLERPQSRGTDVRTDVVDQGGARTTTKLLPIWTWESGVSVTCSIDEDGKEDGRQATCPNR